MRIQSCMIIVFQSLVVVLGTGAWANEPVDLRGKNGIVAPHDLKKFDPPPRSLHITAPPTPGHATDDKRHPVEPAHGTHRDSGPERPKSDKKVPGRDWKPPATVLHPLRSGA